MDASSFIASRLRFRGKMAVVSTAVSFLVIILSLCISAGFRKEIRNGVSSLTGDIQLTGSAAAGLETDNPVNCNPPYLEELKKIRGVREITPAVYRAGIIQNGEDLQGVVFKAAPTADSIPFRVSIPRSLSRTLRLKEGDEFRAYFIGERVQVRKFTVGGIHDAIADASGNPVVFASIDDIRRVNAWDEGQASALEVTLDERFRTREKQKARAVDIAGLSYALSNADDDPVVAVSSMDKYYTLFDWLDLIDFNVAVIIILMVLVAGFNMISGLLIMLFRNISTIGALKALGMRDRGVAAVFMKVASRVVLWGMAFGNALALLFCLIQGRTHFIRLNPDNYFLSYVPVRVEPGTLLCVDAAAYLLIMALLTVTALFISKVDPAETVRVK